MIFFAEFYIIAYLLENSFDLNNLTDVNFVRRFYPKYWNDDLKKILSLLMNIIIIQ